MDIENQIREISGTRWLVRYAKSEIAALNEIAHARCIGSIGGSTKVNGILISDVVQINSDGTERQPYQESY